MSYIPLETIEFFITYFEKKVSNYSVKEYVIDEYSKVLLLEDSLALLLEIVPYVASPCINVEEMYGKDRQNPYLSFPIKGKKYYLLHIEELTYNSLDFKYNHTKFIKKMKEITKINYLALKVEYTKFRGYTRLYRYKEEETKAEYVNRVLPELRLRERYESWEGVFYYFIVIEFKDVKGNIVRTVAYTTQKPHSYIIRVGNELIRCGRFEGDSLASNSYKFNVAFNSWKGIKRQKRLENNLKYFYLEEYFREKDDAWKYAVKLLEDVNSNNFEHMERSEYFRPVNKWKSEELVYKITKKIYKDYGVIYQHRPYFLRSSYGGQMSYDIFISKLDVAIEYQGKQHFEPVDFFGGEDSFEKQKKRDVEKKELSERNGVKLIYINYWEEIRPELIRERVEGSS